MLRRTAVVVLMAVVSAACGARLSGDERAAAIRGLSGGKSAGGGGTAADDGGGTGTGTDAGGGTGTDGGATTGGGTGTGGGGTASGGGTGTGGTGGGTGGGTTSGGGTKCTPGATTDPGINAKAVTVAVASDITGPSPGLFKSSHEAVQAYANYVNSTGGICGRAMKVLKLDTKTESGGNRAAVLDACNKSFALVGSMSAFDDGGAQAVDQCGIPDITAIPTSPERIKAAWTYPAFPNRQDLLSIGQATYTKNTYGDEVVKKAGLIYLNATVTRKNAFARRDAWIQAGFDFVYEQQVQVVEPNFTPYVQQMEDAGVEYVTMVADNTSIARLLKAAKQQGWAPKVWDWDSVAYDPGFITLAGDAAEGSHIFLTTKLFEEASANPEMARYLEWLAKTAPNAEPDFFGIYAWSAAALFVDHMKAIGGSPTRQGLLDKLKGTASWDGHGIHGAHKVASKIPTTCFLYVKIQGGRFVREYPGAVDTLDCNLAGHAQVQV